MFDASVDARVGIPVVNEVYPDGEAGIQKSLGVICRKIREGSATAVMKSYAGNVLKQAGFPKSNADRAAAFLQHVRQHVAYAHDALGTEMIQSAQVSLCVDGAPICIPIGDCFPEGTLLLRDDYALVPIEQIKPGERIWGQDKWVKVEAKVYKGKLKVDAIEMNNGSTMYLTPDHHVYVGRCKHGKIECGTCPEASKRLESFERIHVSDLREGHSLLQPERIPFGEGAPDPDRMYIEGLALADGHVGKPHVDKQGVEREPYGFTVAGRDGKRKEAQKHEVKAICERLGIETLWHRKYITVKDRAWAGRIRELGSHARFKHAETLNLDEAAAGALLRGLMADSTQNTNGPGRTYSTTSHTMMVQVRVLHRMFGRSTSLKMLTPEQHKGAGKHPLWRLGVRTPGEQHALGRAEKTLAVRSIERAVVKVPCWDIQTEDHRVYLPEYDVTVSQCDDLTCALGTLLGAAGIEVRLVRQFFGAGNQQHVLLEAKLENGRWFPLDPSSSKMPAGEKAKAVKETYCSPWDENVTGLSGDAQFVGIGALPVFLYGKEGWRQVQEFEQVGLAGELDVGLGDGPKRWYDVGKNVQAPIPPGKVMLWEGGWWYRDPVSGTVYQWTCCSGCAHGKGCGEKVDALAVVEHRGLGDLVADMQAAVDPIAIAKAGWGQVQGRTWDQAIAAADARAANKAWVANDPSSVADLIVLIVSSAFTSRQTNDPDAAYALNLTWLAFAKRMGIDPSAVTLPQIQQKATGNILIPIAILGLVLQVAVVGAVYAIVIYYAAQLVNNYLATSECDKELVRLQAQLDAITANHAKDGTPLTADEKDLEKELLDQQKLVASGCTQPSPLATPPLFRQLPPGKGDEPQPPFSPWPYVLGAGIVGTAVLGVVYHKEIGEWFQSRKVKK